jgi:hypothetical protein
MRRLRKAIEILQAELIFFPPLSIEYLKRGHACHFRCHHPDAGGARLDVMSKMRGCDPFPRLWSRRTTLELPDVGNLTVLSLQDLVQSKKTQRDKDWPMVRRLVEVDYLSRRNRATDEDIKWWLAESRSPQHLVELGRTASQTVGAITARPWLAEAISEGASRLENELRGEELRIGREDYRYWEPLRKELERMRLQR